MMLHTKYQRHGTSTFRQEDLLSLDSFPLFRCRGNQSSAWNKIIGTSLIEINQRNIPVKLFWFWLLGLQEEIVCRKMWKDDDDDDNRQWAITKAQLALIGELKKKDSVHICFSLLQNSFFFRISNERFRIQLF